MISWSQARVASAILSSIVLGSLLVSCTPDLVGVVYSLLNVRLPAPPVVALVRLLGTLLGEQIIPLAKHMLQGSRLAAAWRPCPPRSPSGLPNMPPTMR